MSGTIDHASELLAEAARALGKINGDARAAGQLLALLGWGLPPGVDDIGLTRFDVSTLASKLEALTDLRSQENPPDDQIAAAVAELVLALKDTVQDAVAIAESFQALPAYLSATQIVDQFFPRLGDLLTIHLVGSATPGVVPFCVLLGIFEFQFTPADPLIFQVDHVRQVVRWDRFAPLFTDPAGLMRDVYGWGTPDFQGNALVSNIGRLLEHFVDGVTLRSLPRPVEEKIAGRSVPEADTAPATQAMVSVAKGLGFDAYDVGLALYQVRATAAGGTDAGLGLSPYAFGTADTTFNLSDNLSLELALSAKMEGGAALVFRAGGKPQFLTGLDQAPTTGAPASFSLLLRNAATDGGRHQLFSAFSLQFDAAAVSAGIKVDASDDPNPTLIANLEDGRISIIPDGTDGFLGSVMPKDGLNAAVNLAVSYSHRDGLRIEGGAGLSATLILNRQLGPFLLSSVGFAITASPAGMTGTAALSGSLTLGPITATIDSVGAGVFLQFTRGNLGPFDLSSTFKAPDGVGLAIDAAGVSGGGFLKHDDAKHEYSGVLQLEFDDIALQAFGLITTQVAGGAGYALIALIDADFPPIQLGWGFTLDGVGGLLALNRAASTDALRAALKAGALSSILFPKNAITNAPQILGQLDALFPVAAGRFLFGPMALIGWGTPTLISAAIAVIVELPEPIRIILLARISARLPSESSALIRLNLDALGVLDLSKGELSFDATLFDSKLLVYTLSGDMALRASWASAPREFLLAIGGFHPQFTPPPGFPALKRITIDMPSGPIAKLRLAAYLAVTSNTVQFGATLDVFIGVADFGLSGHLGFDALLQLNPFHFDADISGRVALTAGGDDLMSVGLDATLSGPAPWYITGSFKIHIVFFDVTKHFSHGWGDEAPAQQIDAVDVLPMLTAALIDVNNWGTLLPDGASALISLNSSGTPIAHPLARLEVHESVVPLGLAITKFGSAAITGATTFTLADYEVNGTTVLNNPIQDDFAPAQFFDLSDEDRLARLSFERHDAGLRMSGGMVTCGSPLPKTISYETFYIDQPGGQPRTAPVPGSFILGELTLVLGLGASARAPIRTAGNRRYSAPGNPVRMAQQNFVVVDRATLTPAGVGPVQGSTYSDVHAALNTELSANPARRSTLQIVSTHEIDKP